MSDDSGKYVIKAGKDGVELEVPKDDLGWLDRILPRSSARARILKAESKAIAAKRASGDALTAEEEGLRAYVLEADIARAKRAMKVADRALEVRGTLDPRMKALPPSSSGKTSSDWINQFLRYAEDVSDESMREVYARIAAGEATRPGTFSLQTLAVLRVMDAEVASAFQHALGFALRGKYLLAQHAFPGLWRDHGGLNLDLLQDAGLVAETDWRRDVVPARVPRQKTEASAVLVLRGFAIKTRTSYDSNSMHYFPERTSVPLLPLTRAGVELALIPDLPSCEPAFHALKDYLDGIFDNLDAVGGYTYEAHVCCDFDDELPEEAESDGQNWVAWRASRAER